MANTIRIKRRAAGGGAGAPSSLENAELAFNEDTNVLYYGTGTGGAGGTATQIIPIAGSGAFAPLDSPALTGTPTAPTATTGTNTTQIATTAFVQDAVSGFGSVTAVTATAPLASSGGTAPDISISQANTSTDGYLSSLDWNTFNDKAPINSPSFTGNPTAPTAVSSDDSTSIATTAFVKSVPLNQFSVPTNYLDMNNYSITNLANPGAPQDAATKYYVDSVAQGLNAKQSCAAATTVDISLNGQQYIDNIYPADGSRVLVKNQNNSSENGIYICNYGGNWSRSADADTWQDLVSAYVFVEGGDTQADTGWVCTINPGGTLGVDPVTWVQFSAAGAYNAGTGLQLSGNTFSIAPQLNSLFTSNDPSQTFQISVNYQGQIYSISQTAIAIANTQVSGLGSMSTQDSNNINVTGGSLTNLTTFDGITIDGGTY